MFAKSAELYDAIYSWKDYGAEVARLGALLAPVQRAGGRRLLDVACGTGKHLELLRQHWDVEGVDLDPRMVELARTRLPGVRIEEADMTTLALGRTFDVVVCLFSSIGYVQTEDRLRAAVAAMARHLAPGGVLAVEPWLHPDLVNPDHVHGLLGEGPGFKVARMSAVVLGKGLTELDFHYLVGRPGGVEHFVERHELGLFDHEQYLAAFREAGVEPAYDEHGLMGRGLYLGLKRPT